MAAGDVISSINSLTNASSLVIQPAAGVEWVIHNIHHAKECALTLTNGTLVGTMALFNGYNIETNLQLHLTNSVYLSLSTNSAQIVGYDGVVTK